MDDMTAFERQVEGRVQGFVGPVRPVDDFAIFDAVVATDRSQRWGLTVFSALKVAVAGVIVARFGVFLLNGITGSRYLTGGAVFGFGCQIDILGGHHHLEFA